MKSNLGKFFWHFWLTRTVLTIVLVMVIRVVVAILDGADLPIMLTRFLGLMIGIATLIGLSKIGWTKPQILGLLPLKPARGFLLGTGIGIIVYSSIVLLAGLAGWYIPVSTSLDVLGLFYSLVLMFFAAAFEEVLFRGVLFQTLENFIGSGWALALSGTLFGVLHLGNANVIWMGVFAVGLAGVTFGAIFILTRDLWLLTGIHLMWNFMQGPIFGIAVSGNAFPSLIQPRIQGPEIFTGGIFGFEAGLYRICGMYNDFG